ncbi:MAG: hypothetical protein J6S49_10920 [Erysipelotrichaceae bacterium]|nr:hypothetical protein [Erysipelotrichaceae bacterium]MBO7698710.1 hypothetical protein [Erysipelotrichaceae bacterium]MBP5278881.1 hypothetical protein [Erysipelotrichaceae bacterium]
MYENDLKKELDEAIDAADEAIDLLDQAYASMNSARNWGIFDMIGGGLVSTMIKREKMRDSRHFMDRANRSLQKLKDELDDVDDLCDLDLDMDDFLSFADFFFDGFFADWLMQGRINDARDKIDDTLREVCEIREKLLERRQMIDN